MPLTRIPINPWGAQLRSSPTGDNNRRCSEPKCLACLPSGFRQIPYWFQTSIFADWSRYNRLTLWSQERSSNGTFIWLRVRCSLNTLSTVSLGCWIPQVGSNRLPTPFSIDPSQKVTDWFRGFERFFVANGESDDRRLVGPHVLKVRVESAGWLLIDNRP